MTPMGAVPGSLNLFHTEVDVYTPVYGPDLMSDCGSGSQGWVPSPGLLAIVEGAKNGAMDRRPEDRSWRRSPFT